jgi:ABC-type lipoprotein export system ATPase subunit
MQLSARSVALSVGLRQLFAHLTFSVTSGHTLALVGPSGVGKSTLLSAIAGYTTVDEGELAFSGTDTHTVDVQWLMQSTPLLTRRSALDNVTLSRDIRRGRDGATTAKALEIMNRLGIDSLSHVPVFRLSGGERQRVAVARTILAEAPVVLADEPTASLDAKSRDDVASALNMLARSGAIVVVATHDLVVASACDIQINLAEHS